MKRKAPTIRVFHITPRFWVTTLLSPQQNQAGEVAPWGTAQSLALWDGAQPGLNLAFVSWELCERKRFLIFSSLSSFALKTGAGVS